MPNLIIPEHKPNPCSSLGHPQEAQQVLSKCVPESAGVSWVAAATQNPLDSPRSTWQPTRQLTALFPSPAATKSLVPQRWQSDPWDEAHLRSNPEMAGYISHHGAGPIHHPHRATAELVYCSVDRGQSQ